MDVKDGKLAGSEAVGASVNYSPEVNATEPNLNLLKRLTETGGGKLLDPVNGSGSDNPFLHDRKMTFQPRDFWEWLLQFAILLFTLDVGVRRIQIDRDEWLRATQNLRRWLFFWRGKPRPVEADESLAALLARRGQGRSTQTAPRAEPSPDLFRPQKPAPLPPRESAIGGRATAIETAPPEAAQPEQPATNATRLLEAQ